MALPNPPRLPIVNGDDGNWGDILNAFLSVSINDPGGTLKPSAVSGAGAEMVSNKDTDGTLSSNSDSKYPSQKAVKTYVDGKVVSPSGSDKQVQFNDGGSFGADSGLTFDKSTDTLTAGTLYGSKAGGGSVQAKDTTSGVYAKFSAGDNGSYPRTTFLTGTSGSPTNFGMFIQPDTTAQYDNFLSILTSNYPDATSTKRFSLFQKTAEAQIQTSSNTGSDAGTPLNIFTFGTTSNDGQLYLDTGGNIGIGTKLPNSSAKLDISSTSQGVLLPRMTTTQKNAISSPANGLAVYDTTINQVSVYNGTSWTSLMNLSVDTDGTLAANSDGKVASQKATKTYVDTKDSNNVKLTGDQTVAGKKTLTDDLTVDNSSGKTKITGSSGAVQEMYSSSADSQPSISLKADGATPSISLGSGGSTAPDVKIQRVDGVGAPALGLNTGFTDFNSGISGSGVTIFSGDGTSGVVTYDVGFVNALSNAYFNTFLGKYGDYNGVYLGSGSAEADTFILRTNAQEITFNDVLLKGAKDPVDPQDVVTKHYLETTTPETSARHALALQTFWDGLQNGTANTLFLGDSITYGFGISWDSTYPQLLNTKIMARYGGVALSWLPADGVATSINDSGRGISSSGSPTFVGKGLGGASVKYTNSGDSQTWTTPHACTSVTVWYKKDSTQGNLKITIDGGTPVVIDTGATSLSWGNKWTSSTLTNTVHSVKVEAATGGSYNTGYNAEVEAFGLDPSTTPRVYNASRFGAATAGQVSQLSNPHWDDSLDGIDPRLVVVHLGTNDLSGGDTTSYQTNLESLLTRLDSLPSGAPAVVLVKLPVNGSSITTEAAMQPWWNVIDSLAASHDNVIVWDLYKLMGNSYKNIGELFQGGIGAGGVHPGTNGHAVMADSLAKLVLPPYYSSGRNNTYVGNLTGNVTGNLVGNVTGNLTGNVTGSTTGTHDGVVQRPVVIVTGSRDIDNDNDIGKVLVYNGSSDITLSLSLAGNGFAVFAAATDFVQTGAGKITIGTSVLSGLGVPVAGETSTSVAGDRLSLRGISLDGTNSVLGITKTSTDYGNNSATSVITASQTADADGKYLCNSSSLITLTLPTTAAVGSAIEATAMGTGGFKIAQNASDVIHFGSTNTTTGTGGSISSTAQYDSIKLVCSVADTEWIVTSSVGNLDVV